jgi:hypothetical protein
VPVDGRPAKKAKSVRTTEDTRACKAKKKYRHNLRTVLPTMCAVSNVSAALQSYSLPIFTIFVGGRVSYKSTIKNLKGGRGRIFILEVYLYVYKYIIRKGEWCVFGRVLPFR